MAENETKARRAVKIPRLSGLFNHAVAAIKAAPAAQDVDYGDPLQVRAALMGAMYSFEREDEIWDGIRLALAEDRLPRAALVDVCTDLIAEPEKRFSYRDVKDLLHNLRREDLIPAVGSAREKMAGALADRALAASAYRDTLQMLHSFKRYLPEVEPLASARLTACWRTQAEASLMRIGPAQEDDFTVRDELSDLLRLAPQEDTALKSWLLGQVVERALAHRNDEMAIGMLQNARLSDRNACYAQMPSPTALALADKLLIHADKVEDLSLYDHLAHHAGRQLASQARPLDARRAALVEKINGPLMPTIAEDIMGGARARGLKTLDVLLRSAHPGAAEVHRFLQSCVDDFIAMGDAEQALHLATDPVLARRFHIAGDLLDEGRAQAIADRLVADPAARDTTWMAHYIETNHPEWTAVRETLAPFAAAPASSADMLQALAPILMPEDHTGTENFMRTIRDTPQQAAAAAQADELRDVWVALADADPDLQPITAHGRTDVTMTADGLQQLSKDVAALMNVVQTQMPVIMPQKMYNRSFLSAVTDEGTWGGVPMAHSFTSVKGSDIEILRDPDGTERYDSGFGFLTVRRPETHTVGGQRIVEDKLFAMPVITIDNDIFRDTVDHGGTDILRNLQVAMGLCNHDYFHHFTARIINPYFGFNSNAALSLKETPFGVLMGQERTIKSTGVSNKGTPEAAFNDRSALGMEQYMRHQAESYYDDADWPRFAQGGGNYEYHALHLHNVLYRDYMDHGPAGEKMRAAIDGYMDGVRALGDRITTAGNLPGTVVNRVKAYYANLMAFHLRRVVPHDHPLMRQAETRIDGLGIDPDYMREAVAERVEAQKTLNNEKRLDSVRRQVDVDPVAADLSPGKAARWNACLSAVNVLNLLYGDKYAPAQAQALSALRQSLSVIVRDMKTAAYRGGRAAFDQYELREAVKDRALVEPVVLSRLPGTAAPLLEKAPA